MTFFSLLTSSSEALYSSSSFCIDSATVGKGLKKHKKENYASTISSLRINLNLICIIKQCYCSQMNEKIKTPTNFKVLHPIQDKAKTATLNFWKLLRTALTM